MTAASAGCSPTRATSPSPPTARRSTIPTSATTWATSAWSSVRREQVTHYYPFGGVMRESTNPGLQPYKYGGKELDRTSGLDAYDFGARMYFADRLQWGQMDPLCEKYYDVSPYGYCANNPVRYIDEFGDSLSLSGNKDDIKSTLSV